VDLLGTAQRRRFLFAALYLSEGAPIGFLWWALPALLRARDVPVDSITTLTAILVLPWTFKWLWAPIVDALSGPPYGLRLWIIATQAMMGLTLIPLAFLDASVHTGALTVLLLGHAVAAATQDAAIDALAIRTVPEQERGRVNGWMQAGMLLGRGAFGGATLLFLSSLGQRGTVLLLAGVIWATGGLVLMSRDPQETSVPEGPRRAIQGVFSALQSAGRQGRTWAGLGFAALAGAGFETAGILAGPFLIDRGYSSEVVGLFFSLVTLPAMAAGALLGGWSADRYGPARVSAIGLVGLSISLALLAAADVAGLRQWLIPALGLVSLGIGVFTAGSYSLFMDITDRRVGATQFSAFMGVTNFCESWSGFAGGKIAGLAGYAAAFGIMGGISLLAIPLLRWTRLTPSAQR
jgi:MFS family permease